MDFRIQVFVSVFCICLSDQLGRGRAGLCRAGSQFKLRLTATSHRLESVRRKARAGSLRPSAEVALVTTFNHFYYKRVRYGGSVLCCQEVECLHSWTTCQCAGSTGSSSSARPAPPNKYQLCAFSPAGAVWCGVRWVFKYFYKSELVILVGSDSVHFVPSTLTHQFLRFDEIQII